MYINSHIGMISSLWADLVKSSLINKRQSFHSPFSILLFIRLHVTGREKFVFPQGLEIGLKMYKEDLQMCQWNIIAHYVYERLCAHQQSRFSVNQHILDVQIVADSHEWHRSTVKLIHPTFRGLLNPFIKNNIKQPDLYVILFAKASCLQSLPFSTRLFFFLPNFTPVSTVAPITIILSMEPLQYVLPFPPED